VGEGLAALAEAEVAVAEVAMGKAGGVIAVKAGGAKAVAVAGDRETAVEVAALQEP